MTAPSQGSVTNGRPAPNMLSMALFYGGAGIHVFPVNGKEPLTAHGFRDASNERKQIEAWWATWPQAGIATADFDVVDVDLYKPEARETWLRIRPLIPVDTPHTKTGGGGLQFFFAAGTLRDGKIGVGIDNRYAGRNYVVLPPSLHPSGRRYEAVISPLVRPPRSAPVFPCENGGSEFRHLLDQIDACEKITDGRNKAAWWQAVRLLQVMPTADIVLVEGLVQSWVNANCAGDLCQVDVRKQVRGAAKFVTQHPRQSDVPGEDVPKTVRTDTGQPSALALWLDRLADCKTEADLFDALAGQRPPKSDLARQQLRGQLMKLLTAQLKALGSGASPAKVADAWLRDGAEANENLQGSAFSVEETEPWEQTVEAAAVLDDLHELYDAYVHATAEQLTALTLWGALTHVFDEFGVSPILDLSSPTKRCGKTSAMIVTRHIARNPLLSGNISPSALYRAVEAWQPTLLIDEADTFAAMSDEVRGILNAGHTRDTAFVIRSEGDNNEPRVFSTWAPKAVAAIGHLPDTIEDRSVRIPLSRKPTSVVKRDAFDPDQVRADCLPVRRKLVRVVLDNLGAISAQAVERPSGLHDRAWNNWRPLLMVAAVAGEEWLARAEAAAVALSDEDTVEESDDGVHALQHVWEIVEPLGRVATADVLAELVKRDDAPWAKYWEAKLAKDEPKGPAAKLSRLLKPFGVKPRQLWIDGQKQRGFDADDFRSDMCAPYLQKDGRHGRDGRTGSSSQAGSTVSTVPTVFSGGARAHTAPEASAVDWDGNAVHVASQNGADCDVPPPSENGAGYRRPSWNEEQQELVFGEPE
jgi:hypothetical protein